MHFDLIMFSPVVNVFVLAIAVLLLIILLINISMGGNAASSIPSFLVF